MSAQHPTLGTQIDAQRTDIERAIEQAHHEVSIALWRVAKLTSSPLEAQAYMLAQWQDDVLEAQHSAGQVDDSTHLRLCLDWLKSCGIE